MSRTSFNRRSIPTNLRNHKAWPDFKVDGLEAEERERAVKLRDAVERYLNGEKAKEFLGPLQLTHTQLLNQLNRCLEVADDGRIYGWRALKKNLAIKPYTRKQYSPTNNKRSQYGHSGRLGYLLSRFPDVKRWLDEKIIPTRKGKHAIREHRVNIVKLNEDFQQKLLDAGVTASEWPFIVQYAGYRSLATYVNALRDANLSRGTQEKSGDVAALRLHVGTGKRKNIVATAPYDLVQIDAHKCNFFGTVGIPHPRGTRWVVIERMWIIIVVDCFSDAILGYSIAFSTEVNADDVLRAIENALSRHELRKLTTPGVSYRPGSGFPSGVFESLVGAGWACLMLDNSLAHLSIAVTERARRRVGCAVNFGPVGHWFRRPQIERVFGSIENAGFMRLHSTSGRSNTDPLAKDATNRALQAKLTSDAIEDLTEVILADNGASLKEGLGFISSIDLLRLALEDNNPPFLPMLIAESPLNRPLTVSTETRPVGGNQAEGRRAHMIIDRVKYTNAVLSSSPHLMGKYLTVEIDEEDMRVVRAFFPDGTELGALTAIGPWGLMKHTRRMRKEINKLLSKRHLILREGEDPVSGYLRHLAEMASADSENAPKKVSRAGTKVVHTSRKTDTAIPEVGSQPPTPFSEPSSQKIPKDSNRQTSRGINLKPQY